MTPKAFWVWVFGAYLKKKKCLDTFDILYLFIMKKFARRINWNLRNTFKLGVYE